ncbi:MAG: DNA repair protein RadC [Acidobacteriota bacterium]
MSSLPDYLPARRLFQSAWDELSDLELLALILGPGNSEAGAFHQAHNLLRMQGSAERLRQAGYRELRRCGLERKRAVALLATFTLITRIQSTSLLPGQTFRSSVEIFRHFQPRFEGLKKECFWNVLLDGKNRMLRLVRISEGSLTSSLAHPREVYRPAIQEAAAGVLFVHNHPSGDPQPSREDVQITRRLVEAGRIVGIRPLDHVIIGARSYFSFADQGML